MAQPLEVILPHIHPIDQHGAAVGVVEAQEQLEEGGLAEAVLALNLRHLARSGGKREVAQHVAFHLRVAESDVAELHLLHLGGKRQRVGRIDYRGLEVEEFEQVAHKEAVVVESGDGAHEAVQLGLSATEGFEEDDERTHRDASACGTGDKEHRDEEEGRRLGQSADGVVHTQSARDAQQVLHQNFAYLHKALAEIGGEAESAHLLGIVATAEKGGVIAGAAVVLGVAAAELVNLPRLDDADDERGDHSHYHHHDNPRGGRGEHRDDDGDGDQRAEEPHKLVEHPQGAEARLLLGPMVGVVIFGVIEIGHIQSRRLPLHDVADIILQPLVHHVVVHAVADAHQAVQQEDDAEDAQQQVDVQLYAVPHRRHARGHRIDQILQYIQVHQGQHAQHHHIEYAPVERPLVAEAYHV